MTVENHLTIVDNEPVLENQHKILMELEKLNMNIDRQDLLYEILHRGHLIAGLFTGRSAGGSYSC